MEACVVICRSAKPKQRRNKILFINAINEVTRERAQSFLTDSHIERVVAAYRDFTEVPGFARAVPLADIRAKDGNLSIPLYVAPAAGVEQERASYQTGGLDAVLANWLESSAQVRQSLRALLSASPSTSRKQ